VLVIQHIFTANTGCGALPAHPEARELGSAMQDTNLKSRPNNPTK